MKIGIYSMVETLGGERKRNHTVMAEISPKEAMM
jgi:hypothetical protein